MPNLKRKVSHSDFLDCYNYFDRAIRNNRFMNGIEQQDERIQAIASLWKIQPSKPDVQALQLWIDQFVDADAWSKCYKSLNQKKYLARNSGRNIQITDDAYLLLKSYASDKMFTLSEAIISLVHISEQENKTPTPTELNGKQDFELIFNESVRRGHEYIASVISSKESKNKKSNNDLPDDTKSYKEYRERIKRLTTNKFDETLLEYFDEYFAKPLNHYISTDNISFVSEHLFNFRQELLKNKLLSSKFISTEFVISKALILPQFAMEEYGDELTYILSHAFGCDTANISSSKKELEVFTGNRTNVQVAYKTFNYLTVFLRDEEEAVVKNCHKNMKRKNRYSKAAWHCRSLLHKMFPNDIDEDLNFKLLSDEERKKLSIHTQSKVDLYYDLSLPIDIW